MLQELLGKEASDSGALAVVGMRDGRAEIQVSACSVGEAYRRTEATGRGHPPEQEGQRQASRGLGLPGEASKGDWDQKVSKIKGTQEVTWKPWQRVSRPGGTHWPGLAATGLAVVPS